MTTTTKNKRIFLVNNKKKEPNFAKSFCRITQKHKVGCDIISSLDCAFKYDRTTEASTLFIHGTEIDPTSAHWFIRAWAPSEDASALLALFLELHKIPFTDKDVNASHEIRTSKLSQAFQLGINGCQSPNTFVVPLKIFTKMRKRIEQDLSYPLVVKARGGLGKRVWKCDTKKELTEIIKALKAEANDDLVLCQELIENSGDLRVVVFKGKVLASIERSSTSGFLNNVSQGGTAQNVAITAKEAKLACKAAAAVGLELAGVDIVRSEHGPLIFEVNKAPDITSFNKAAGIDIASVIAEHYLKSVL